MLQGPLAYKVPEAGLGQPARVQGFPRETGLILRCAGKAGNPFQMLQGPLAYKVPEAGLGQPARIQGSVPWTSSGH